jgi:hypothetical protein
MKKIALIAAVIFAFSTSCKKPVTEPNAGIYRGTFFQIYDNGDTNGQGITYIALSKESGTFSLSGDTATGAPYTCYGDYSIDSPTHMTFINEAVVEVGYQPYYLLDTTYEYTFDDHAFTLRLQVDTTRYEYNLIRD